LQKEYQWQSRSIRKTRAGRTARETIINSNCHNIFFDPHETSLLFQLYSNK